ncbi:MAG TPA: hypothetical protein VFN52_06600 [Acidiferrobacteraceae bacterium]|nr:hypothetical protein [Acidiferrobacteraceae bacterium]
MTRYQMFAAGLALLVPMAAQAAGSAHVTINPAPGAPMHEHGTAVLKPSHGGTWVIVHMHGIPHGAHEPMHIHKGECGSINPKPSWALKPVSASGVSKTRVPVSLKRLEAGHYAINLHQSLTHLKVYVACGNIPHK